MPIVGLAVALVVATFGWFAAHPPEPDRADAADIQLVALGERVYGQQCAGCHGPKLEGEPDWRTRRADGLLPAPPHDASGHTWHHADAQLFDITQRGVAAVVGGTYRSSMPAFGKVLSDREIWAVLAFIKSRWPADIRAAQERTGKS